MVSTAFGFVPNPVGRVFSPLPSVLPRSRCCFWKLPSCLHAPVSPWAAAAFVRSMSHLKDTQHHSTLAALPCRGPLQATTGLLFDVGVAAKALIGPLWAGIFGSQAGAQSTEPYQPGHAPVFLELAPSLAAWLQKYCWLASSVP